jgi:SPP1 family predicted phage head-tail adaptor
MLDTKQHVGKLDRRILFQSPNVTDGDANSDIIDSWDDEFYAYAEVKEEEGNEVTEGDRLTHIQKVKFTVRFDSRIINQWRIVYGGFAYRILSKQEIARRGYLKISTEYLDTAET